MKKVEEKKFIEKWRTYNSLRDLFWEKKHAIEKMAFKASIWRDIIKWLETDCHREMQTVLKLDIPHKLYHHDPLKEAALSQAWAEVLQELQADGFNVDSSHGGSEFYHLIMKIVSDEEEIKIKKKLKRYMNQQFKKRGIKVGKTKDNKHE